MTSKQNSSSEIDVRGGQWTRRDALKGVAAVSALALSPVHRARAAQGELITRQIPSSGRRIPVIGLGTNNYSVTAAEDLASRREVLARMPQLGGALIDTAPSYGRSEDVLGELLEQLGNRTKFFLATKATAPNDDVAAGQAQIEASFKKLRTNHIELIQVHSLAGIDVLVPVLLENKAAKRIDYIGATTSNDAQHGAMAASLRKHRLDFVQVNYSIDDRESAKELLPLAQERGAAVIVNLPFGGRRGSNIFSRVSGKPLPAWAAEFDATSWAQFFLKYVVSHPAVTCIIPGTTKLTHLEDNQAGGRGRLPDAAMRKRMEAYWDGLS